VTSAPTSPRSGPALPSLGGYDQASLAAVAAGHPMVVNMWASWCGPCAKELPYYEAFSKKYAGQVDVLGIDWQETRPDSAQALIKRAGVTYPLVTDPKAKVSNKYLPKLIMIDADGKVTYQKSIQIKSLAELEALVEKHLEVAAS
jgi:thiol-disulfide isomerase/thioredoxin